MRDSKLYLKDILAAMEAIEQSVEGVEFENFKNDPMKSDAVIGKFGIIGYAAKSLPEEIKRKYPAIPWKDMVGWETGLIRFKQAKPYYGSSLIQLYSEIKHKLVWKTIIKIIPKVKPSLMKILDDLETGI